MIFRNRIELEVSGRYAMFTDPLTVTGGERCSLPVPTYEALKGIVSAVYWVPQIRWMIEDVRVMEQIRTESVSVKNRKYYSTGCDLSLYTYLKDVRYRIKASFTDGNAPLSAEDEHRYYRTAQRMLSRGGRLSPYLGTRRCPAVLQNAVFSEGSGYYDNGGSVDLGLMYHSPVYSDKGISLRLWRCSMVNGVISFPAPEECSVMTDIQDGELYALV